MKNGCTVTVVMHHFMVCKFILKFNQQANKGTPGYLRKSISTSWDKEDVITKNHVEVNTAVASINARFPCGSGVPERTGLQSYSAIN